MKKLGLIHAMILCKRYTRLTQQKRDALREQRLRQIVAHARAHSPFYQQHYAQLGQQFDLQDLPPTNKQQMMQHFDHWLTDRSITLAKVNAFMQNPDNIGRPLAGKYMVFTTSGSTGNPSVVLYDASGMNVLSAVNTLRAIADPKDMRALMRSGFKTAGVFATGGFYLGNSSVRARLLKAPWKKRKFITISVLDPLPRIVAQLNAFAPAMLGSYPTALELLMQERNAGRLKIAPKLIMSSGEYLSEDLRAQLQQAFGCKVQSNYSCTEAGAISCECIHGHFHINDDWVLVEPVDALNRPVPEGIRSDKVLITNLFNYTQPLIRFEITDRIILHREGCPCGNPSPWVQLEGRTDDILLFEGQQGTVRIPPLALYALIKQVHPITRFQLIQQASNRLALRVVCDCAQRQNAFERVQALINDYLAQSGVLHMEWLLLEGDPQPHPQSGKFKHVYADFS